MLNSFLVALFKSEKVKINSVDIIFCNDQYLKSLNKEYLQHNYNTDTVTFILSEDHDILISEAYLSIDTIKQNAKRFNVSYQSELIRVIIHSCLHMCGYSDRKKSEAELMMIKQENYLLNWHRFT